MKVSIHDRAGIERLYPEEAYAHDAGINSGAQATVLYGVRIVSAVDSTGEFTLERAARHVGEAASGPDDSTFLAPFLDGASGAPVEGFGHGNAEERRSGERKTGGYASFIGRIIAAARGKQVRPQPAPDDERLRGPRQ